MSEGRREGLPPPKPMGRFVSSWIGDDRLAVAPLARPDVVSADGGPLKKRNASSRPETRSVSRLSNAETSSDQSAPNCCSIPADSCQLRSGPSVG